MGFTERAVKDGLEAAKGIERLLGTHAAFDFAKVYVGVQPGDIWRVPHELIPSLTNLLTMLSTANPDFKFRVRSNFQPDGYFALSARHHEEIREIRHRMHPEIPKDSPIITDLPLILFYHSTMLFEEIQATSFQGILGKIYGMNDVLQVMDYAPGLTVEENLMLAHVNLAKLFYFPGCCVANYPNTVRGPRDYLAEDLQPYIEFVPCAPNCPGAIQRAGINKRIFDMFKFNKERWLALDSSHSHGAMIVSSGADNEQLLRTAVARYSGTISENGGVYLIVNNSRAGLKEIHQEVSIIPGVNVLRVNTIL